MWVTVVIELIARIGNWFMQKTKDRKEAEKVFGEIMKAISDHTERIAKDREAYRKARNEKKDI